MNKALAGIKVIEFSHIIAGPFCGMLLGDLGADVIKVERPGEGEYGRIGGTRAPKGASFWFPGYNRNKRGVTLNLKNGKAKDILCELIKRSDVFLENFRPGLLNEMGFGYDEVKKLNNRIIMVSLSGYGQHGPYAKKTAFDMNVEALGGLMALTGEPDGLPMKVGVAISDFVAGLYGVIGVMTALRHREKSGEGQYVDVAMLDGVLSLLETSLAEYAVLKKEPPRPGNKRAYTAPSNIFPTRDGYIYISAFFQTHWEKLCRVMGREELTGDVRFSNGAQRKKNEKDLEIIICEWLKDKTSSEACELLDRQEVPCSPVCNMGQILNDPHIKERGSIIWFDYPGIGKYPIANIPVKFSSISTSLQRRPPLLGEHNKEIICNVLGYSEAEYQQMLGEKIF